MHGTWMRPLFILNIVMNLRCNYEVGLIRSGRNIVQISVPVESGAYLNYHGLAATGDCEDESQRW
jgi:hypothetical protein